MPGSWCAYGCINCRKENGIEYFRDSHMERKKSNKNFGKSGFKHLRE